MDVLIVVAILVIAGLAVGALGILVLQLLVKLEQMVSSAPTGSSRS